MRQLQQRHEQHYNVAFATKLVAKEMFVSICECVRYVCKWHKFDS